MPATLALEEYQYSDTGILLNGDADGLPFVDVEAIEGLDTAPFRSQIRDREGIDGGYVDARFMTVRTIVMEGKIYTIPNQSETYIDALKANFAPTEFPKPFYFQTDAGQRVAYGKSLGLNYRKDALRRLGVYEFQLQIVCEDPRVYDPLPVVASTSLNAVTTSGRTYPKSYPLLYGVAASNNALQLYLGGNRQTTGLIRINGPVVNPSVVYDNTGTTLAFNTTIANGDYIEIDLGAKSVLMNGTAPRRNVMSLIGSWFYLSPGANDFRYFGTQTPPTPLSTMSVSAYSAWL
jgi:hypothetical protein